MQLVYNERKANYTTLYLPDQSYNRESIYLKDRGQGDHNGTCKRIKE